MSDPEETDESGQSAPINRRRILQGISAGTASVLAGCGGDSGGPDETTTATTGTTTTGTTTTGTTEEGGGDTTTTTEEPTDTTTVSENTEPALTNIVIPSPMSGLPTEHQYNFLNHKQKAPMGYFVERLGDVHFGRAQGEGLFYPVLCDDIVVDMDNGVMQYSLKDSKWFLPEKRFIDSRDLENLVYVLIAGRNMPSVENTSSIKKTDERTLTMKLRTTMNPVSTQLRVAAQSMQTPYELWNRWIDIVKGARKADMTWDRDELSAIQSNLLTWRVDEPFGHSMYSIDSINPTGYVCSVNEGHMHADKWEGVKEIKIQRAENRDRILQRFLELDAPSLSQGLDPDLEEQVADRTKRLEHPHANGTGFGWQFRNEPFGDVRIRQAFMYVWNREDIAQGLFGRFGVVDEIPTGVIPAEDEWFPQELLDKIPTYGVQSKPDEAEELLSRVPSLSKPQGSEWWHFNEEVWEPKFTAQASGSRLTMGRLTSDQLQQFGVNVNLQTVNSGKLWGTLYTNNTFDQFPGAAYAGWGRPTPFNGMIDCLGEAAYVGKFGFSGACGKEGVAMGPEFDTEWDPLSIEESDLVEYETCNIVQELPFASPMEDALELLHRGGWVYAYQLPFAPLVSHQEVNYLKTDKWTLDTNPDEMPNHNKISSPFGNLVTLGRYYPKRVEE